MLPDKESQRSLFGVKLKYADDFFMIEEPDKLKETDNTEREETKVPKDPKTNVSEGTKTKITKDPKTNVSENKSTEEPKESKDEGGLPKGFLVGGAVLGLILGGGALTAVFLNRWKGGGSQDGGGDGDGDGN